MTRLEFINNQEEFCYEKKYPVFLPIDGYCYSCGADVVNLLIKKGRTGKEELITACPECHVSFCE